MTDVIEQYAHSPHRYRLLDGTAEMSMGVFFLFWAFLMWLSGPNGVGFWNWVLVMYAGIGLLWAASHFGTRYVRRQLVYPRSGYVKMRKRPWEMALMALLSFAVAASVAAYVAKPGYWVLSPILAIGLLLGLASLGAALRFRVKKYIIYAAISVGIGILLQFTEPLSPADADIFWWLRATRSSFIWYGLVMGVIWFIGGLLTLYLYAHRTPKHNLGAE